MGVSIESGGAARTNTGLKMVYILRISTQKIILITFAKVAYFFGGGAGESLAPGDSLLNDTEEIYFCDFNKTKLFLPN